MTRHHRLFSSVVFRAAVMTATMMTHLAAAGETVETTFNSKWPTTEFKVLHHDPIVPFAGTVPLDKVREWFRETLRERVMGKDMQAHKGVADMAWARLVEGYLHDIAMRYQEAGFEPPELRMVEDGGKKKYLVYLVNINESLISTIAGGPRGLAGGVPGLIHQLRDLTNWTDYIVIGRDHFQFEEDKDRELSPGRWRRNEVYLYSTLAHELFHALQFTYDRKFGSLDMIRKGAPGKETMVEGMADGAAMYLVSIKFPGYLEKQESTDRVLGGFKYDIMFLTAEGLDAYYTRSFWFHVAERFGGVSVLERLLRRNLSGLSMADRIRWLDEGLKNNPEIREGLYTIFPHFTTELASYGSGRYERVKPSEWLRWTLGGCKFIEFNPQTEVEANRVFEILGPIEAQCVETTWNGFPDDGQLQIEVIGKSREVVDQIHLGIAEGDGNCWKSRMRREPTERVKWTCTQEKLKVQTGPKEGKWAKTWELEAGGYGPSGRAVWVVSNIAVNPWEGWSHDSVKPEAEADGTIIRFGFARTETQAKKLGPPTAEHMRLPAVANTREATYGIRKNKPMRGSPPIPPITIPVGERNEEGEYESTREYKVMPAATPPITPGYTGPFYGMVTVHDPSLPHSGGNIMSTFCDPSGKLPIGRVLRAEEDQLKVHVKTDLCEMTIGGAPPFPRVDHLDAIIVLPFGWRYFRDTAPVDEVTAGVQIFIDRYHERMGERLGAQWPFGGAPSGGGPDGGSGPVGGTGPGAGGAVTKKPECDCSCTAFNKMRELAGRNDPESKETLKQMSVCSVQCMSQWMACGR